MMRKKRSITLGLTVVLLLSGTLASALNLQGSARYNYSDSTRFEDGQQTSESSGISQNYNFNVNNRITPLSSYTFSVRSLLSDTKNTDSQGVVEKSYSRRIEPGLDLSLSNPMYSLGTGYRRQEDWTTRNLANESRRTNENFYGRLGLNPFLLPSLNLNFDRSKTYDHFAVQKRNTTDTGYSLASSYQLPSKDIDVNMSFNLSRNINENPLSRIVKTISDSFSGSYNIAHSINKFNGMFNSRFKYSSSYSQSKTQQFVSVSGDELLNRTSLGGLHTTGSIGNENVGVLSSEVALVDENLTAPTSIDLNADRYHNIGIWVSSQQFVEKIYIYVNRDISGDATLAAAGNWRVYRSDFNQDNTWTPVTIGSVNIAAFDAANNVYRYEIEFTTQQKATYFKAVNMELSDISNVLVTEIEAYGIENIPDTNIITNKNESLSQRIGLSVNIVPSRKLRFNVNYSIDRSDSTIQSLGNSYLGIFQDIVSKDTDDSEGAVNSTVMRGYGITASWKAHELFSPNFRVSRSETYDKKGTTDNSSNSYAISISSSPFPAIGTNFSLTRSDSFVFDEKKTTNHSAVFSMALALYENVNMIQDMGYGNSKSFDDGSESDSYNMGGNLDIEFTPKLSNSVIYSVTWTSTDDSTSVSKNMSTTITYRPGRLINISANLSISDSNGAVSSAQGLSADWLPLKRVRLSTSYSHQDSGDSNTDDKISFSSSWNITKLIDAKIAYAYEIHTMDKVKESQSLSMNMNGRF